MKGPNRNIAVYFEHPGTHIVVVVGCDCLTTLSVPGGEPVRRTFLAMRESANSNHSWDRNDEIDLLRRKGWRVI